MIREREMSIRENLWEPLQIYPTTTLQINFRGSSAELGFICLVGCFKSDPSNDIVNLKK